MTGLHLGKSGAAELLEQLPESRAPFHPLRRAIPNDHSIAHSSANTLAWRCTNARPECIHFTSGGERRLRPQPSYRERPRQIPISDRFPQVARLEVADGHCRREGVACGRRIHHLHALRRKMLSHALGRPQQRSLFAKFQDDRARP